MPLQRCQNLNTMKKIKLDELDKDVSSIAEYKKCAIPRYCKENGNIKNHLDELSISNNLYKLGKKNPKITEVITVIRFNKLSLNEYAVSKICKIIKEKLKIKNAASVYQFVNLFNLSSNKSSTLIYIQRCFTIVSDNESFLELKYKLVSKILASSELLITSEIEVLKVANNWLNHKNKERSKYAEDLLSKVRLHLLSTETIRHILNNSTLFKTHDGCVIVLNKMLDCRKKKLYETLTCCHTSRYCNQKYFNIMLIGGANSETLMPFSILNLTDACKLGDIETYQSMNTKRIFAKVVYLKGDIYVFSGLNNCNKWEKSIEKYSISSKTWSQVSEVYDDRNRYCACAFMDKIFIFGGYKDEVSTKSCLLFDTKDNSWKEVANMNQARAHAACAIFEDRIVVTGGINDSVPILNTVKYTVESYDVLPDKWSKMPKMNSVKYDHSLVVVKNKLFVISKTKSESEVFDNICKKFNTIKSSETSLLLSVRPYTIKHKIFILKEISSKIITYDTYKNEWSEESCEVTKNLEMFSSVKVPCL